VSKEILDLKQSLLEDMVSYMKYGEADDESDPAYDPEYEVGYTQEHINHCSNIIDTLLTSLTKAPKENKNEFILKTVKIAVLDLNQLNEQCNGTMIETYEREQLCELIITAASNAGLVTDRDDITEGWRRW
jgi:hypothetical protein